MKREMHHILMPFLEIPLQLDSTSNHLRPREEEAFLEDPKNELLHPISLPSAVPSQPAFRSLIVGQWILKDPLL